MTFAQLRMKRLLIALAACLLLSALAVSLLAFRPYQAHATGGASDASRMTQHVVKITTNSHGTFTFSPKTLPITVGTTVVWKNMTQATHTVTSDVGTTLNSGFIAAGSTFSFTFTKAGTFTYHCQIHPFMTGTIIVK